MEEWDAIRQEGGAAVLATVVHVEGSSYRKPGARMLVNGPLAPVGCVSGGCLEGDLLRKAGWLVEAGRPVLRRYDTTDEEGYGVGCNGVVDVLIEPLWPESACMARLREAALDGRRGVLGTVLETGMGLSVGDHCWLDGNRFIAEGDWPVDAQAAALRVLARERSTEISLGVRIFFEYICPPSRVVIFGAGRDAVPVVAQCRAAGWDVTVVDPMVTTAPSGRFPPATRILRMGLGDAWRALSLTDAWCVVMTHNLAADTEIVQRLVSSDAAYIGIMGPRARSESLLGARIADPRVHAPIGLDLGGDGPDLIALGIAAELCAAMHGRAAGFLRDRDAPIRQIAV